VKAESRLSISQIMYRIWEAFSAYYYGQNNDSEPSQPVAPESLSMDWVYIESEMEHILQDKMNIEQEDRKREIQTLHANPNSSNSRAYWIDYFQNVLDNHPLSKTEDFSFNLPLSMRHSIMQQFIRGKSGVWVEILKHFHDVHFDNDFQTEKWEDFQSSFVRVPRFNNKGKEGTIIDFALLAYEGVLSGKSLARILWAWSKTLMSFLDTDFGLVLDSSEITKLEEMLSESVLDIIEMHVTACIQSRAATNKLGSLPTKWLAEKKEITQIDAKYVPLDKTIVEECEKPKESMQELQKNLLMSLVGGPLKRQVEEIPEHEKMLLAAFYDAKTRLQSKFDKMEPRVQRELDH